MSASSCCSPGEEPQGLPAAAELAATAAAESASERAGAAAAILDRPDPRAECGPHGQVALTWLLTWRRELRFLWTRAWFFAHQGALQSEGTAHHRWWQASLEAAVLSLFPIGLHAARLAAT